MQQTYSRLAGDDSYQQRNSHSMADIPITMTGTLPGELFNDPPHIIRATGDGLKDEQALRVASKISRAVAIDTSDAPFLLDSGNVIALGNTVLMSHSNSYRAECITRNGSQLNWGDYASYAEIDRASRACLVAADGYSLRTPEHVEPGDLLAVYSDTKIVAVDPHFSNGRHYPFEFAMVDAIDNGEVILSRRLVDRHTDNPRFLNLSTGPLRSVHGGGMLGLDWSESEGPTGVSSVGFSSDFTRGFIVDNCIFRHTGALVMRMNYDSLVKDLQINSQQETIKVYGVVVTASGKVNIDGLRGFGARHMFTTGGLQDNYSRYGTNHDIVVQNFDLNVGEAQTERSHGGILDTHAEGYGVVFRDGVVRGAGQSDMVSGTGTIYLMQTRSRGTRFENIRTEAGWNQKHVHYRLIGCNKPEIRNCVIKRGGQGIWARPLRHSRPVDGVLVDRCEIDTMRNDGIVLDGGSGHRITNTRIRDTSRSNTGYTSNHACISIHDTKGLGLGSVEVSNCDLAKSSHNQYSVSSGGLDSSNLMLRNNILEGYGNSSIGMDRTDPSAADLERVWGPENGRTNLVVEYPAHTLSDMFAYMPVNAEGAIYDGRGWIMGLLSEVIDDDNVCLYRTGQSIAAPLSIVHGSYHPTTDGRLLYFDTAELRYTAEVMGHPLLEVHSLTDQTIYARILGGE